MTRRIILGVIFRLFGIPGGKEGDVTGHDRVTSEDETKGVAKA